MLRITILFFIVLMNYAGVVSANQCKIVPLTLPTTLPSPIKNNFTFRNTFEKGLDIYIPVPDNAIVTDGVVYRYKNNNRIGMFKYMEKFLLSDTIEKTIEDNYNINCDGLVNQLIKSNFKIFIVSSKENDFNGLNQITVFILNEKDDSYFYLLSFAGYPKEDVIQMLIRE